MKRFFLLIFSMSLILSSCSGTPYTYIGTPAEDKYAENITARCPWDMIFYDGSLYIGGGDYDKNSGPIDLWRYSEAEGVWSLDATLPDEEISRFTLFPDGSLVIPGIDPREDWSLGNYYVKGEDGWQKVREIPGGIHTFDIAEHAD